VTLDVCSQRYTLIVLFFPVLKVHLTMQILFVNEDKRTIINNIVSKLQNYSIRLFHCPKKKKISTCYIHHGRIKKTEIFVFICTSKLPPYILPSKETLN
jgi:hypothetical protein